MSKKKKYLVIHNDVELLAYIDLCASNPFSTFPPFKFSKAMIKASDFKIEKDEVERHG